MAPFWAMWLENKGLSPSEIGIIIAVPHFMKIFMAPLISQAADRRDEYWRPLIICTSLSVLFSAFYFVVADFWPLFFITVAVNISMPAIMPLLETITVSQTTKHHLNYGWIRSFGSASFIVASVFMGWFLKSNSVDYVVWVSFGCLCLIFISALFLPRGNKKISSKSSNTSPIIDLLKQPNFIWFLCAVGLLQMSHGVYYSMGSIHWKNSGINEDIIGLLWAIGVIAEIAVFIFMGKIIDRTSTRLIFAIIGVLGALRWAVMGFSVSLPILFAVQLIHGLTFGASHFAAINYLSKNIDTKFSGSAQSLYTAFPLGLGMALSTYFGSLLFENFGGNAYYAMSLLCFLTVLLTIPRFSRKI